MSITYYMNIHLLNTSVYHQSQITPILQDPTCFIARVWLRVVPRSLQQPRRRILKLSCSGIPGTVLHLVLPRRQCGWYRRLEEAKQKYADDEWGVPAVRSSFLVRDVYTLMTLTMCREQGEMSLPEFSCWKLRIREISNKKVYQKVNVENSNSWPGETRTGRQRCGTPKPWCAMANLGLFASGEFLLLSGILLVPSTLHGGIIWLIRLIDSFLIYRYD